MASRLRLRRLGFQLLPSHIHIMEAKPSISPAQMVGLYDCFAFNCNVSSSEVSMTCALPPLSHHLFKQHVNSKIVPFTRYSSVVPYLCAHSALEARGRLVAQINWHAGRRRTTQPCRMMAWSWPINGCLLLLRCTSRQKAQNGVIFCNCSR